MTSSKLMQSMLCLTLAIASMQAAPQDLDKDKTLNIYSWGDYFAPNTLANFTSKYGITVHYDTFASGNELEAKLMAGDSGYDIVVPSTMFYPRGIRAGIYRKLDKSALPNWQNLDAAVLRDIDKSGSDPQNAYAMPYIVGYTGFIFNAGIIKKLMPDAPVDSLRMLFDPAVAGKLKQCGINYVDSPEDVIQLALLYLGKSPNTQDPNDIKSAYAVLRKVHDTVRTVDSSNYLNALGAGDICLSIGWVGNDLQAQAQAKAAGKNSTLQFVIATEGAPEYIDNMLIMSDAPHAKNALLFLNYIMTPQVSADIINALGYPMANAAAIAKVYPAIASNATIYPSAETRKRIVLQTSRTGPANRAVSDGWVRYKAGE